MIIDWFLVSAISYGLIIIFIGYIKYRSNLNPLMFYTFTNFFMATLFSYCNFSLNDNELSFPKNILTQALFISNICLTAFCIPFFLPTTKLSNIYSKALIKCRLANINSKQPVKIVKRNLLILFLLLITSFCALAYSSDNKLIWLIDPREAYLHFRSGNGIYYLICTYTLLFSYIYTLFNFKKNKVNWYLLTIFFLFLSYFLGKKGTSITCLFLGLLFYNYYIQKVTIRMQILFFFIALLVIASSLILQSGLSLFSWFSYFDYIYLTSLFLYNFDLFGYYFGKAFLSSFWVLIPRSLYPHKPHEYGVFLIQKELFPDSAEAGHFGGYLMWTQWFLDFGIYGVFFYGLFLGLVSKVCYEYYLKKDRSLFSFIFMVHFSFLEIYFLMPVIGVYIISIFQKSFFQIKCLKNIQKNKYA